MPICTECHLAMDEVSGLPNGPGTPEPGEVCDICKKRKPYPPSKWGGNTVRGAFRDIVALLARGEECPECRRSFRYIERGPEVEYADGESIALVCARCFDRLDYSRLSTLFFFHQPDGIDDDRRDAIETYEYNVALLKHGRSENRYRDR